MHVFVIVLTPFSVPPKGTSVSFPLRIFYFVSLLVDLLLSRTAEALQ